MKGEKRREESERKKSELDDGVRGTVASRAMSFHVCSAIAIGRAKHRGKHQHIICGQERSCRMQSQVQAHKEQSRHNQSLQSVASDEKAVVTVPLFHLLHECLDACLFATLGDKPLVS